MLVTLISIQVINLLEENHVEVEVYSEIGSNLIYNFFRCINNLN